MSAPSSPPWFLSATRRRGGYASMRISDAERSQAADLLSRHYGDGRLDEAEFQQRLDQVMRAKTYGDLGGLFDDLPRTEAEASGAPHDAELQRRGRRHRGAPVLLLVLVIGAAVMAGHAVAWFAGAWIWLALLGAILFLAERHRRPS